MATHKIAALAFNCWLLGRHVGAVVHSARDWPPVPQFRDNSLLQYLAGPCSRRVLHFYGFGCEPSKKTA